MFYPLTLCACSHQRNETFTGELRLGPGLWAGLISSGRCSLDAGPTVIGPGDLFLANGPLELHTTDTCHTLALSLDGRAAEQAAAALEVPLLLPGRACPRCSGRFSLLLSNKLGPGRTSSLAYALLCDLWEAQALGPVPSSLASQAIALMREHFATIYGVEELATQLCVSKCHLIRQFSATVGTTPGQYLIQVRLAAAKELLLCQEYTLESIAGLCGFSGSNYFCRVFHRVEGMAPSAWVKANSHRSGSMVLSKYIKII